ncbi:phage holin family protein [Ruegeria pomeroyi]|uniref:phage holin family protein n=1 Tax=Ruegeria pomeroyi TaxID=89184 RepID=UPI001F41829D|nr:phage holin family protein [Ruegeria pomeroyi]MCE8507195.1 phage holin family protein [Ruegeria pomeroyi]
MSRRLLSIAALLVGNAIGLLLAALLLDGFSIAPLSLIVVVIVFSLIQALAEPLIRRLSARNLPALQGGISLVVIFVGLLVTELVTSGLVVGGISNLLAATLLVWLGALIAGILLPRYVFKSLRAPKA